MKTLAAFASGLLFAAGLGVSGMTSPDKVLAFLRLEDFSLMLVMGAAVTVYALAFALRRKQPLFAAQYYLPEQTRVDAQLLAGSVIFGVGWGLSGWCPGPALMSLVTGSTGALVFGAAALASAWLTRYYQRRVEIPKREAVDQRAVNAPAT